MRWEEPCPIPESIHEYIGLLDVALGSADGIVGLVVALMNGAPYLEMQLERKESKKAHQLIERARKAGCETLDYETMSKCFAELRNMLRELRTTAKPITREVAEAYWSANDVLQPPRHLADYTAFAQDVRAATSRNVGVQQRKPKSVRSK